MQIIVRTPHIRVEGEVTDDLVEYLRQRFGEIEVIEDDEDELIEIIESDWYRSIKPTITPGENMRVYRELHGLTQSELAAKLGAFSRQNISNMENGHRPISKAVAKRLPGCSTSQSKSSSDEAYPMEYDTKKVDEITMALLYLTVHDETPFGARAWKGFDWDTLDRLHAKGLIGDPASKARSVTLSPQAVELARELFVKHFGIARR
jgi:transcriptional regulator with XRE-family HTH domain